MIRVAPSAEAAVNIAHLNKSSVRSDWASINVAKVQRFLEAYNTYANSTRWKKPCFSNSPNIQHLERNCSRQAMLSYIKYFYFRRPGTKVLSSLSAGFDD
jgi:hypothetical protein